MSTHCTIKFVVRNKLDHDDEGTVTEFRLLQYADGYEDYVRPHLETALEEVRNMAIPEEISAGTIASTYGMLLDNELPTRASSMTRPISQHQMEYQAGRWQWLVEATVDQFTDSFEWRIIGGSDFT